MPTVVLFLELNEPQCAVVKVKAYFRRGCVRILGVEGVAGLCPTEEEIEERFLPQVGAAVLLHEWHASRPSVMLDQRTVIEPEHPDLQTYFSRTIEAWLRQLESVDESASNEARRVLRGAGLAMAQDLSHVIVTGPTELISASLKAVQLFEAHLPRGVVRALSQLLDRVEAEVTGVRPRYLPVGGYSVLLGLIQTIEVLGGLASPLLPALGSVADWCEDHELAHRMWRVRRQIKIAVRNASHFPRSSD